MIDLKSSISKGGKGEEKAHLAIKEPWLFSALSRSFTRWSTENLLLDNLDNQVDTLIFYSLLRRSTDGLETVKYQNPTIDIFSSPILPL